MPREVEVNGWGGARGESTGGGASREWRRVVVVCPTWFLLAGVVPLGGEKSQDEAHAGNGLGIWSRERERVACGAGEVAGGHVGGVP
jgi:hypothetical protein